MERLTRVDAFLEVQESHLGRNITAVGYLPETNVALRNRKPATLRWLVVGYVTLPETNVARLAQLEAYYLRQVTGLQDGAERRPALMERLSVPIDDSSPLQL